MRISGGKARGIPLRAAKAPELRPATEANRERLFSSLGQQIQNARVLDLFAGTGSYGLEALSRGAAEAYFVEKNRKITKDLKDNLSKVLKSAELSNNVGKVFQKGCP
jgi:16S rRNA (guanine966-N2)-methyltransferase